MDLAGQRALITGSGVGIGQAIAVELARHGASVAVHHPPSETDAAETVEAIGNFDVTVTTHVADLRSRDKCLRLVNEAADALGGLDILVNNAALSFAGPFDVYSPDLYQQHMDLNIGGVFWCSQQAVARVPADPPGRIINIGSFHGQRGFPGYTAYAATKGAVDAFTRSLAVELAPRGIRVNTVSPGVIEVPRYFDIAGYTTAKGDSMIPIGRVGKPQDIANLVRFLVSDGATYLTGQVIAVDGGTSARMGLWWEESETVNLRERHNDAASEES